MEYKVYFFKIQFHFIEGRFLSCDILNHTQMIQLFMYISHQKKSLIRVLVKFCHLDTYTLMYSGEGSIYTWAHVRT